MKRAVLMMDSDEAGRAAAVEIAATLQEASIEARAIELPAGTAAKDPAEFIAQGGTADEVRAAIAGSEQATKREQQVDDSQEAATTPPSNEVIPQSEISNPQSNDGAINFSVEGRVYRIRGLSATGLID